MKKILFILSMVLAFASCSSDDDNKIGSDSIVGYWEFTTSEPGEVVAKDAQSEEKIKNYIRKYYKGTDWEFFKDGKVLEHVSDKDGFYTVENKYTLNGENRSIVGTGEDGYESTPWKTLANISGNTLTLIFDDAEEIKKDYPNAEATKAIVAFKYTRKK